MSLELIIGPMFAGKSSAVLQRIRRARAINRSVFIATSSLDTRYDSEGSSIKTHDQEGVSAVGVKDINEIFLLGEFGKASLIILEEAQFFTGLYDSVVKMVEAYGKDVIVVGLDGDSDRKPFGDIIYLVPIADVITKLTALCKRCGDGSIALFTSLKRDVTKDGIVCVGGADTYEPLCRKHFNQS